MSRRLGWFLAAALLAIHTPVEACEGNAPCSQCAKGSEMSWNPDDKHVSAGLGRFYSLNDRIKAAYESNDMTAAAAFAKEYLSLAATYRCNWNYGNAIHDANSFLGLISLKAGDRDAAAAYLLKAGKSTGSPQLDTFGPDLDLADALLKDGQVEPVKAYLRDIKVFWKMDNGQVAEWLTSIDKGGRPELNRFAKMPDATTMPVFWFAIAWPALVCAACLFSLRRRIPRKWLFGVTALVCGYLAMIAASWIAGYLLPQIIGAMDSRSPSLILAVAYIVMAAGFLFSVLAIVGVSRFFVAKRDELT
jgi:hypothetical protein